MDRISVDHMFGNRWEISPRSIVFFFFLIFIRIQYTHTYFISRYITSIIYTHRNRLTGCRLQWRSNSPGIQISNAAHGQAHATVFAKNNNDNN